MEKKTIMLIGLFLLFMAMIVYSMLKQPHRFGQSECPTCHVMGPSGKISGRNMTAAVAMLCRDCHEKIFSEGYMHPYNIRPQTTVIPKDMPLDQDGNLTCATCHDVHSSYFTPYGTPSHFLRRYDFGADFCKACHPKINSFTRGHKESFGQAHVTKTSKYKALDNDVMFDPVSRNCLSCHDGSAATNVSSGKTVAIHSNSLMQFDGGQHPIGINYERARTTNRKLALKPIGLVDGRVQFFDGKIGCCSCHNPYSQIEKRLIMSDRGSSLCFACHEMGRP